MSERVGYYKPNTKVWFIADNLTIHSGVVYSMEMGITAFTTTTKYLINVGSYLTEVISDNVYDSKEMAKAIVKARKEIQ